MITFALRLFLITIIGSVLRVEGTCDENEFQCDDGTCIDSFFICDGEKNCPDGSDETKNVCSKNAIVCPPFGFKCAYGACIDGDKKCNGKQDCADNSDEKNPDCGSPVIPLSNNSGCGEKFQCDNGQCISEWEVCDGTTNCRDGSDESDSQCVNFPCPQIVGFQCSYGGCINKANECNGVKDCRDGSDEDNCPGQNPLVKPTFTNTGSSGTGSFEKGCALPLQPEGGKFVVKNCPVNDPSDKCRRIPNTLVGEFTTIEYECIEGYALSDPYSSNRYCVNSTWVPQPPITCLKLCKGLKSTTVDITCTRWGMIVNCSKPALPMTKANLKCKDFFRIDGTISSSELVCQDNGLWSDDLFRCTAECGYITTNKIQPLASFGHNVSAVEYPWHTGLYTLNETAHLDLFCGGSIITPYLILTAAHCVVDSNTKLIKPESSIKIAVGKTTRSWNVKDLGEQRFEVKKIFIHNDFRASDNNYAFDVALLEIKGEIVIGRVTLPVCIEFLPQWTSIKDGTEGTAVGWGRNENDTLTEVLMAVNLPYVSDVTCKSKYSPVLFRKFITHDKFCGLYKNGAGVQQGDSGGGYVFKKPENGLYYIRGIVSTKLVGSNVFATFTNVSSKSINDFIRDIRIDAIKRHL